MVVILIGSNRSRAARIGRALADALGWPSVDADDPHALHTLVATVLGRRQHLVAAAAPLSTRDQESVRGHLHNVRFVDVTDTAQPPGEVVGWIRREFGV